MAMPTHFPSVQICQSTLGITRASHHLQGPYCWHRRTLVVGSFMVVGPQEATFLWGNPVCHAFILSSQMWMTWVLDLCLATRSTCWVNHLQLWEWQPETAHVAGVHCNLQAQTEQRAHLFFQSSENTVRWEKSKQPWWLLPPSRSLML